MQVDNVALNINQLEKESLLSASSIHSIISNREGEFHFQSGITSCKNDYHAMKNLGSHESQ